MKKFISKALALSMLIAAVGINSVTAYDAVCLHPNLQKQDVNTYTDNGDGTHLHMSYHREWCNDCGHDEATDIVIENENHNYVYVDCDYVEHDGMWIRIDIYECACGDHRLIEN